MQSSDQPMPSVYVLIMYSADSAPKYVNHIKKQTKHVYLSYTHSWDEDIALLLTEKTYCIGILNSHTVGR